MTYNVFGDTLNLTQILLDSSIYLLRYSIQQCRMRGSLLYRVAPKMAPILYALTYQILTDFLNYFTVRIRKKGCNNTATKDPTTHQVCRYTTL